MRAVERGAHAMGVLFLAVTFTEFRVDGSQREDYAPHAASRTCLGGTLSAKRTRPHSPGTVSRPRRLSRRNPRASLIQPICFSAIHCYLA